MRFLPLPKGRAVKLANLRTIQPKWYSLANIEQVPPSHRGQQVPMWMRWGWGQYYVRPGERYTNSSRAPGVWDELLKRIGDNTNATAEQWPARKAPLPGRTR